MYDQRLVLDSTVERLKGLGIGIHVRSVLLQGLLLQSPYNWPNHLSSAFRAHHARWLEQLQQEEVSPLAAALGFAHAIEGVEAVLVGVVSRHELVQILQAWSHIEASPTNSTLDWAWGNEKDIDPRFWPRR